MNKNLRGWAGTGLLLLLGAVWLTACSSAGVKYDTTKVKQIVRGTTTKSEIRAWFGPPPRTEDGIGGDVWVYTYTETHTTGAGALGHFLIGVGESEHTTNILSILFNGEVVKDYSYSGNSGKAVFTQ